jgi:hypothetical protein
MDTSLMGLQRRFEAATSFEYEQLVTFEINVLVSTLCSLRGSQNADQKLVESFGLLGLRTPPHGLNLRCYEQTQLMATSRAW